MNSDECPGCRVWAYLTELTQQAGDLAEDVDAVLIRGPVVGK